MFLLHQKTSNYTVDTFDTIRKGISELSFAVTMYVSRGDYVSHYIRRINDVICGTIERFDDGSYLNKELNDLVLSLNSLFNNLYSMHDTGMAVRDIDSVEKGVVYTINTIENLNKSLSEIGQ